MNNVAKMYADLIRLGIKTMDDVPEVIKDETAEILNENEDQSQQASEKSGA